VNTATTRRRGNQAPPRTYDVRIPVDADKAHVNTLLLRAQTLGEELVTRKRPRIKLRTWWAVELHSGVTEAWQIGAPLPERAKQVWFYVKEEASAPTIVPS
jgi:hypothetical protein